MLETARANSCDTLRTGRATAVAECPAMCVCEQQYLVVAYLQGM